MSEPVTLRTERLLLRQPLPADALVVGALLGDAEVMRFLGGAPVPPEGFPVAVERWRARWQQNGMGPFIVERRDDGSFLGRVGILVWDTRTWTQSTLREAGAFAQPELGWALARAFWGNGYATEAATAVREWARLERGVDSLVSLIAKDNVASQRVAERLGATAGETVRLFDTGAAVVWRHGRR